VTLLSVVISLCKGVAPFRGRVQGLPWLWAVGCGEGWVSGLEASGNLGAGGGRGRTGTPPANPAGSWKQPPGKCLCPPAGITKRRTACVPNQRAVQAGEGVPVGTTWHPPAPPPPPVDGPQPLVQPGRPLRRSPLCSAKRFRPQLRRRACAGQMMCNMHVPRPEWVSLKLD
jgi:hypothetical protein